MKTSTYKKVLTALFGLCLSTSSVLYATQQPQPSGHKEQWYIQPTLFVEGTDKPNYDHLYVAAEDGPDMPQ